MYMEDREATREGISSYVREGAMCNDILSYNYSVYNYYIGRARLARNGEHSPLLTLERIKDHTIHS